MRKLIFAFLVLAISLLLPQQLALAAQKQYTREELNAMGIIYVRPGMKLSTSGITGPVAGTDFCYQLATPTINDTEALGKAIDDYIESLQPGSPFIGLGADIVAGAARNGVNPMFVVGNLRMESRFGTTGQAGSPYALEVQLHNHFNAFGRRGSKSTGFPQLIGPGEYRKNSATGDIIYWYDYPSWKDSVNSPTSSTSNTTDQPSVMRKVYLDDGIVTMGQYLARYAPASDGNDESAYGKVFKDVITSIIQRAGTALSCGDSSETLNPNDSAPENTTPVLTDGPR